MRSPFMTYTWWDLAWWAVQGAISTLSLPYAVWAADLMLRRLLIETGLWRYLP